MTSEILAWSVDRAFFVIPNLTVASGIGKSGRAPKRWVRAPATKQPPK